MKTGDVNHASFKDVWHGNQRKQVMDRLDVSKDCNFHCLRDATNRKALDIKESMRLLERINRVIDGVGIAEVEEFDRFI